MLAINLCYALGPLLDFAIPRVLKSPYRWWAFRLGLGVSVAYMVLAIPLLYFDPLVGAVR